MEFEITQIYYETPTIISVKFKKENINYRAGTYMVYLLDVQDAKGNFRDFSFASSPTEDFILISTRITGTPYKQKLASLKKDDKVSVKGPFGHFFFYPEKEAVMIAGGIGITPFRSMTKYAIDSKLDTKITLFYGSRTPEEIAFRKELYSWQKTNPNFKVVNVISSIKDSKEQWNGLTGFIDEKIIRSNLNHLNNKLFYICGPPPMVDAMFDLLKLIGVKEEDIRVEHFTGY